MSQVWVLALFLFFRIVKAADADAANIFITPPDPGPSLIYAGNPVWGLGIDQRINWITTWKITASNCGSKVSTQATGTALPLYTVCEAPRSPGLTGASSFSIPWNVQLYTSNLTFSNIYFFWLQPNRKASFHTISTLRMGPKSRAIGHLSTPLRMLGPRILPNRTRRRPLWPVQSAPRPARRKPWTPARTRCRSKWA
jgi:hypothetical protein